MVGSRCWMVYQCGFGNWFEVYDMTYTVDTTIAACNIDLYEITVSNGAKLTLDVANETVITGPFEVALGSQFEVK